MFHGSLQKCHYNYVTLKHSNQQRKYLKETIYVSIAVHFRFQLLKLISTIFHFVANEMNTFFYYSNEMNFEKNRVKTLIILNVLFYIFFYDISNVSQNKKYFYLSFLFPPQKLKSRMELICWHHLK